MSTEAWKRAVEAGARAMVAAADLVWDEETPMERKRWKLRAGHALRAAFPILAEELVAYHDEQAHAAERYAKQAPSLATRQQWEFVADTHRSHASTLRARIEQMKEPQT